MAAPDPRAQQTLYRDLESAAEHGLADDDWVRVESHNGAIKVQIKTMDGVNPDTVWTWNAIGKRAGAWNLDSRGAAKRARASRQPSHQRICCRARRSGAGAPIPIRSPARPPGSTFACGSRNASPARRRPSRSFRTLPPLVGLAARRPASVDTAPRRAIAERRAMTSLPRAPSPKRLGLVIDLDTCVGCHACATNCKEWNTSGHSAPLTDVNAYQAEHARRLVQPGILLRGGRLRRRGAAPCISRKNCLHCEKPDCVTVCPTGASYKRAEDGIVLIDHDRCIGCKLCAWACPYGAREVDEVEGVMKKCTLCIDKIYNENLPEADRAPACVTTCPVGARHFGDFNDPDSNVSRLSRERGGFDLMPETGYRPTSKYLPPRPGKRATAPSAQAGREPDRRREPAAALGGSSALAIRRHAPCFFGHSVHDRRRRGLWPSGVARLVGSARPRSRSTTAFGFCGLGLAAALFSIGLLSSTFHLGRPERALLALTQWRSSWLAREGVAALATYIVAGPFALGWIVLNRLDGLFAAAGVACIAMAIVTVVCTAMIYASLEADSAMEPPLDAAGLSGDGGLVRGGAAAST